MCVAAAVGAHVACDNTSGCRRHHYVRASATLTTAPRASRRRSERPAATPPPATKRTSHAIMPASAKKAAATAPARKAAAPAPKKVAAPAPAKKAATAPPPAKKSAAEPASTSTATSRSAASKQTSEVESGASCIKSGVGRVKESVAGGNTDVDEDDATVEERGEGQERVQHRDKDAGGEDESDYMSALDEEDRPQTEKPEQHLGYLYMGQEDDGAGGLPFHLENGEEEGSEVNDEQQKAEIDEDGLLHDLVIPSQNACEGLPQGSEEVNWNDKEQVARIWACVLVLRDIGTDMRRLSARRSSLGRMSTSTASTTKVHSAASARAVHSPPSLLRPSRALVGTSAPSVSESLPRLLKGLRVEGVELDTGSPGAAGGVNSEDQDAPVAAMETETTGRVRQRVRDIVYDEM